MKSKTSCVNIVHEWTTKKKLKSLASKEDGTKKEGGFTLNLYVNVKECIIYE